jgi:flagellar motor switch protein FliM
MASPKKLSADQVAALVGDLMDKDLDVTFDGDVEVRPFVFGQNDTAVLGEYYALQMVNERFCRLARNVFLPMLRIQPRISSFPPELRSFDDYRSSQDNFVSITASRIEELRGNKLVVIPPSFVSLLTDAYYGGAIKAMKPVRNEFTASEGRVIEIVASRLNDALQLAWRDLVALTFSIVSHEENMQFAQFVDAEDMVVICSFMVQIPGADPASFDVIYPLQTLKPISSQLRSRMQSDFVDDDQSWRLRLERAILEIPLQVSARLCEPEIPLRQLMQLRSGDVIPAQLADHVEVLIEGRKLFAAQAGNLNGQSAIRVLGRSQTHDN